MNIQDHSKQSLSKLKFEDLSQVTGGMEQSKPFITQIVGDKSGVLKKSEKASEKNDKK